MPSEIHAGAALAGFRVGALIGQGAMGAVYLADDVKAGRPVALKVLTPALSEDERFRQRFLRETSIPITLTECLGVMARVDGSLAAIPQPMRIPMMFP